MSLEINEADLKYFTAAALSGLCANPSFTSPQGNTYLKMKKLSMEKIAINSALQVMAEIQMLQKLIKEEGAKLEGEATTPEGATP